MPKGVPLIAIFCENSISFKTLLATQTPIEKAMRVILEKDFKSNLKSKFS